MHLSVALLRRARRHVGRGGVIAYATESCFGLGCAVDNERALLQVLRLKQRPKTKGLIVIADRAERFHRHIAPLTESERQQVEQSWPGPHTWLIRAASRTSRALRGQHAALAVRVTAHPDARDLCARLRLPLVSTSANRNGQRPIKSARECARQFGRRVFVIPGRIGQRKHPSTIQDLHTGQILR
ncbi:MAG: Sua5/YciO/YrdC/YwlC family protein [Burkholderiales bacterium]